MKNFMDFITEEKKVWKAILKVSKDGKIMEVPVESEDNVRSAVHSKMAELGKQGYKLESVDYDK